MNRRYCRQRWGWSGFLAPLFVAIFLSVPALGGQEGPKSFAGLVGKLLPSVVNIATTQNVDEAAQFVPPGNDGSSIEDFFRDFFGDAPPPSHPHQVSALGSGFIVDPSGYVVTNSHVVSEAEEIRVILTDERTLPAEVVGADPATDLALLKVDADEPLPALRWGSSDDVQIGDWLVAIGNAFGLGGTVTTGVLSARARDIRAGPYDDFLQTDAAINRGNSGGPLFDSTGGVIGVNTVIVSPTGGNVGVGFAIPASTAKPIIDQLRKYGVVHRGWLGVQIQPVNERIAEAVGLNGRRGTLVADVADGGPADAAGLKPGDVILNFDGRKVIRTRDLPRIVANTEIGKTVTMRLWRDGKEISIEATVGERKRPDEADQSRASRSSKVSRGATLGMGLTALDDIMRERLGLSDAISGVLVTSVQPGSPAAENGVRPGDVVVAVNRSRVEKPTEIVDGISDAKERGRKATLLRIVRGGIYRYIALPV